MIPDPQAPGTGATPEAQQTADNAIPPMNREQLSEIRAIAQQKIEQALRDFAQRLPQGYLYVQNAINAMGAVLDNLERQTGQYDATAQFEPTSPPNPDLAKHREEVAGVEESDESDTLHPLEGDELLATFC